MSVGEVTHVRAEDLLAEPVQPPLVSVAGVGRRRQLAGTALALLVLPLLTVALHGAGDSLELESEVLLYLLAVVVIAVVGGIAVALASAIVAAFLINYFFIRPVHTLEIDQGEQALALAVFLIVAAVVSVLVELAARRARAAERAAREAATLSELAGADLEAEESLKGVLERARATFQMESVTLKVRERPSGEWIDFEQAGWAPSGQEAPLRFDLPSGTDLRLVGRGPSLFAQDQRVLDAFAAAAQTAYEGHRLTEKAREAQDVEAADRQRAALLAAVGHDLRTPLAGIKVAVDTLRQEDVALPPPEEQAELLGTIEESVDRLRSIVANLLDASRLQAGALSVQSQPVALDEVISAAVIAVPGAAGRVVMDVPDDLPLVQADPGLLERVLANLLENALRHGPEDTPVEVSATAGSASAKLKVVDHGPGIPAKQREQIFGAFQRIDDGTQRTGVGLGLTVARGFVEAMGGVLIADSAEGGGLVMRIRLPLAQ